MKIGGPFLDKDRRGSPKRWYLSFFIPKKRADGSIELNAKGRPILVRKRPYYASRDDAAADKPVLAAQYAAGGTAGPAGILNREQVSDYEQARAIAPEVPLAELARFWRLHHPLQAVASIAELVPLFTDELKARVGETRHWGDLKHRLSVFCRSYGDRNPQTFTRDEFLTYLLGMGKAGRTVLNQKRAIVTFFNWLVEKQRLPINPLAGLKKRHLPKASRKEIGFLSIDDVAAYLRAAERYDPVIVAHEVIQLFAGVRSDDEMADFRGEWVLPRTREIVIPADVAKTGVREVISGLEDNFWSWWEKYGRDGLLRPTGHQWRWRRLRILAAITDPERAAHLSSITKREIFRAPEARAALTAWPWNARRRTFCTYHVAKYQSADRTALILRHRGDTYTLHNSYRGTGVTPEQGAAYFQIIPSATK